MTNTKFDLHERTADFGARVIQLLKELPKNEITRPLISQLVRSATSIGANYSEADGADTRREFIHRISICKRESKETYFWLKMLSEACPEFSQKLQPLKSESQELILIFAKIVNSSKQKLT